MYSEQVSILKKVILLGAVLLLVHTTSAIAQSKPSEETEPKNLIKETIYLDITTSSYYELQDWLEKLSLDSGGSRREVENRLLEYYRSLFGEVPLKGFPEKGNAENSIEITSAQELDYSLREDDKALIELDGGVSLYMRDKEGNTAHTVTAKSLVFNQINNSVTARGAVSYKMQQGGTDQEFKGEQISFNIDNYSGVFIRGMSTRDRQIQEQQVSFYFKGGTIYRMKRDTVTMNDGIISSSRQDDPYYHISAGNVWLLDVNEWALRNATLYVGHVPLLYVPFFYRPGSTFVMHPSIGVKTVEGYYIQTTTYFLGRQPEELGRQTSLSFMQAVEDDEQQYNQELRGFFLHTTREERAPSWAEKTNSFGKFQLDYYSRLGFLSALNFQLNQLGWFEEINLLAGIALTNYIYPLSGYTNAYTTFTFDPSSNRYASTAQHSYFFGTQLPLRFGFDLQVEYKSEDLAISLSAPLYSDLLLHDQLRKRNETLGWTKLLTGEGILETNEISEFNNPKFYQHTSYRWRLPEKAAFIDRFRFEKIDSQLALSQNDLPDDSGSLNPSGYYYPQTFTPIDIEMSLGGTLLPSSSQKQSPETSSDETEQKPVPDKIRPPWSTGEGIGTVEKSKDIYKVPDPSESLPVKQKEIKPLFAHSLNYTLEPDFSYHTQFDTGAFDEPEEVEFYPLYSYLFADGSANISYGADLFRNSLQFEQTTKLRGRYRDHMAEQDGYDLENLLKQDRSLSYFSVVSISDIKNFFWLKNPALSQSYTSYTIETELYRYAYDEDTATFQPTYTNWSSDSIQNHRSQLRVVYESPVGPQQLYTLYRMPPDLQQITGGVESHYNFIEASASGKYTERSTEEWEFGPIELSGQLNFFNSSLLKQEFTLEHPDEVHNSGRSTLDLNFLPNAFGIYERFEWNLDEKRPSKSTSSLQLWWLTGTFEMRHTDNYTFSLANGWEKTGTESFQPYQLSAQLKIPYEPEPKWKNRVRISSYVSSALQLNLLRYTDSVLQFSWNTQVKIAEFLDVQLKVSSANNTIYQYIPAFTEELGVSTLDPIEDLRKSFNFFDRNDRLESKFNLQNISFSLIHYMHDWQLNMEYSGRPELNENNEYTWMSEFSIFVQWSPIPEIRKQVDYAENELQL
jgi:hypothetical protein